MFGVGIHDVNCDQRLVSDATNPIYIGTDKMVEVVLLPSSPVHPEDEDEGYERYKKKMYGVGASNTNPKRIIIIYFSGTRLKRDRRTAVLPII